MVTLMKQGPSKSNKNRFREIMTMASDGEHIAVDWEVPNDEQSKSEMSELLETKENMKCVAIRRPVVLIVPALGTDSDAGYIRVSMKTFTDHGWIAVAMNYRGFGGKCKLMT